MQFTDIFSFCHIGGSHLQQAMPPNSVRTARVAWILFATAFAAGAVDIIGFAKLDGVFASVILPLAGVAVALAAHQLEGGSPQGGGFPGASHRQ